jgi:hypothetical protein
MSTSLFGTLLDTVATCVAATVPTAVTDGNRPVAFAENQMSTGPDGMPMDLGFDIQMLTGGISDVSGHTGSAEDVERFCTFSVTVWYVNSALSTRGISSVIARDCASFMDRIPRAVHDAAGGLGPCEVADDGFRIERGVTDSGGNIWSLTIIFNATVLESVQTT